MTKNTTILGRFESRRSLINEAFNENGEVEQMGKQPTRPLLDLNLPVVPNLMEILANLNGHRDEEHVNGI